MVRKVLQAKGSTIDENLHLHKEMKVGNVKMKVTITFLFLITLMITM